jgi:hypothetical protein
LNSIKKTRGTQEKSAITLHHEGRRLVPLTCSSPARQGSQADTRHAQHDGIPTRAEPEGRRLEGDDARVAREIGLDSPGST